MKATALFAAFFVVLISAADAATTAGSSPAITTPLRNQNIRNHQRNLTFSRCETTDDCSGTFLNNIDVEVGVRKLTGPHFTICPGLSLECKLRCDQDMTQKTTKLYIKMGGEDASPTNYDAKDESLQCNKTVVWKQTSQSTVQGLSYYLNATSFLRDVSYGCNCVAPKGNTTLLTSLGCFSASDTVHVQQPEKKEGLVVAMKDLQVGDSILVESNFQTEKYEPVYGFGHYHRTNPMTFWTIYTATTFNSTLDSNTMMPLEMTADHMIFVHSKGMVRADQVQVGDLVQTDIGSLQPVTRVVPGETPKEGMYMPLTRSGYLMVNDIQVSAYISFMELAPRIAQQHPWIWSWLSEQTLFHAWMAPYRLYCTISVLPGGLLGNANRCHPHSGNDTEDNEGILGWLLLAKWLLEYANESCLLVQVVMGMLVFPTLAVVNGLEVVLESCSQVAEMLLVFLLIGLLCCCWSKGVYIHLHITKEKAKDA